MTNKDILRQLGNDTFESIRMLLQTLDGTTDAQIGARPGGTLPSIAFHVWHSARWLDYDCAVYDRQPEVWDAAGFVERWGLVGLDASDGRTGTGLGDDESAALALPGQSELMRYTTAVLRRFEEVLGSLDDESLSGRTDPRDGTPMSVYALLLMHLTHVNRHLGMVEAIKGLLGLRGSATR